MFGQQSGEKSRMFKCTRLSCFEVPLLCTRTAMPLLVVQCCLQKGHQHSLKLCDWFTSPVSVFPVCSPGRQLHCLFACLLGCLSCFSAVFMEVYFMKYLCKRDILLGNRVLPTLIYCKLDEISSFLNQHIFYNAASYAVGRSKATASGVFVGLSTIYFAQHTCVHSNNIHIYV